jgi:hypothetical protein
VVAVVLHTTLQYRALVELEEEVEEPHILQEKPTQVQVAEVLRTELLMEALVMVR